MSTRRSVLLRLAALLPLLAGTPAIALAQDSTPAKGATAAPAPVRVLLTTSEGEITLELDAARAPRSVANFVEYVRAGHYDGTIFHRVIDGFMIQGGGFTADMTQKPTRGPIPLESRNGLKNVRGSIAMARTSDPNSATAQFFINVADNARLDHPQPDGHGYAVFGAVVAGMETVDRIRRVPTGAAGMHQNAPVQPVLIRSARVLK